MYYEDIKRFYTDSRLESVVEGNGFLKETHCQKEGVTIYTITQEGREFVKDKWNVTAYTFKSLEHDDVLRRTYLDYSKEERYRTLSEPDFRKYVEGEINRMRFSDNEEERSRGNEMSMKLASKEYSLPDMATIRDADYKGDGHTHSLVEYTLVESVTANYKESQIESKISFANDCHATMEMTTTF